MNECLSESCSDAVGSRFMPGASPAERLDEARPTLSRFPLLQPRVTVTCCLGMCVTCKKISDMGKKINGVPMGHWFCHKGQPNQEVRIASLPPDETLMDFLRARSEAGAPLLSSPDIKANWLPHFLRIYLCNLPVI